MAGWTGIQLQWRPVKTVTVAFQEQWRWETTSRFDRRFHQFEVKWDPKSPNASLDRILKSQSLPLGCAGAPSQPGRRSGRGQALRWQAEHGMELKAGRWEFKTRVRCQEQTALALKGGEDPAEYGQRRTWRFKGAATTTSRDGNGTLRFRWNGSSTGSRRVGSPMVRGACAWPLAERWPSDTRFRCSSSGTGVDDTTQRHPAHP